MRKSANKHTQTLNYKLNRKENVCSNPKCERSFGEPIKLTVILENGTPETYEACPYCFSQLTNLKKKKPKRQEIKPTPTSKRNQRAPDKNHKPTGCPHSFGYLSTRPKNSPIPDECLTCFEITKCMLQ